MNSIEDAIAESLAKLKPGTDHRGTKKALETLKRLAKSTEGKSKVNALRGSLAEMIDGHTSPAIRAGFIDLYRELPSITTARVLWHLSKKEGTPSVRRAAAESKQAVFEALRTMIPNRSASPQPHTYR